MSIRIHFLIGSFIAVWFLSPSLVSAATSTDSMIGYWKLDETSENTCAGGADICDYSGDGNHGTLAGTAPLATTTAATDTFSFPNTFGYAFDGNDYIDVGDVNDVGTDDFSVSLWFKTSDTENFPTFISKKGDPGWLVGLTSGGALRVSIKGDILPQSNSHGENYNDGAWHHAVVTFDRDGNATFYVDSDDGTPIGVMNISGFSDETFSNSISLLLGSDVAGSNLLTGSLDDVRMYSRVLSSDEVADLATGDHTSATWDGSTDTDYEKAANWDINAVPDPYTILSFTDNVENNTILTADIETAGITLMAGQELNLSGFNLTMNDSGAFSNNSQFSLKGTETLTGFTHDTDSGTVRYVDGGEHTGFTLGNEFNNLTLEIGTWTLDAPLDLNGSLILNTGSTLDADGHDITVGGSWSNASNNFVHGGNTVTLDGTNQIIQGDNIFFNLTKSVTSVDTISFNAGDIQTIEGTLTLTGQLGELLSLRKVFSGSQWRIDPQGTRNISYVDVEDSNNINATEIAFSDTINYGDNLTGWSTTDSTPDPPPSGDDESSESSSSSSSSSSQKVRYGCKDESASNYQYFVRHRQSLCEYADGSSVAERIADLINEHKGLLLQGQKAGIILPQSILVLLDTSLELGPVRDIELGMEGEDVRKLQELLIEQNSGPSAGELTRVGATGYFGAYTRNALGEYQETNGVAPPAGYFGPITRVQMKAAGLDGLWW